jgi:hypothetical protein
MHYSCSEYEDGDELGIEKNGSINGHGRGPARYCGTMDGWVDYYSTFMTMTRKLKCIGGYINILFRNQTYAVYQDE